MNENLDSTEIDKFSSMADQWWDPEGRLRTLHIMNPVRLAYIDSEICLVGKQVLDVGCGGGLLAEAMAKKKAIVTGLDASDSAIEVARMHSKQSGQHVDYIVSTPEKFADQRAGTFDVVTCMEMLEHVPDPESVIAACAKLVKPKGHVILSTVNRTAKAYALAVLGAEYLLNILPRGTHNYAQFIRPSELAAWCRRENLNVRHITGMTYLPVLDYCALRRNTDVNYMLHAELLDDIT
jgi:2-polyprenyl-6-hydroxyphenyl methylase/3-demethylubiquinone-9 3-methyltransferase